MADLLPLARFDMRQKWAPTRFHVRREHRLFRVMGADMPQGEQDVVGGYDERWRFRLEYEPGEVPRADCLLSANPFSDMPKAKLMGLLRGGTGWSIAATPPVSPVGSAPPALA